MLEHYPTKKYENIENLYIVYSTPIDHIHTWRLCLLRAVPSCAATVPGEGTPKLCSYMEIILLPFMAPKILYP